MRARIEAQRNKGPDLAPWILGGLVLLTGGLAVGAYVAGSAATAAPAAIQTAQWAGPAVQRAAPAVTRGVLKTPTVSNTKLQNIVRDLYKGTTSADRVGTGTTMDAIRQELLTGQRVQGVFHIQKGQQYSSALQKVLKQDLSYYDRVVAQSLYDDLQRALGGQI